MTVQGGGQGGWFPDPWQPAGQIRWWSGVEWTPNVHPMPQLAREVDFGEAIKRGFRGWNRWSGRASATEYWWWFLFAGLVSVVMYFVGYLLLIAALIAGFSDATVVSNSDGMYSTQAHANAGAIAVFVILGLLVAIAFVALIVVPWLAVGIRRLHDTGRSGAWMWLLLVPFGSLFLTVFLAFPSNTTQNQYGPVPV